MIWAAQNYGTLLHRLQASGVLSTPAISAAFAAIPREHFLPAELRDQAGRDEPFPIGHGQTNSQPRTVAFMLELLQPQAGQSVLDIGSGSGWTTALLAHIVGEKGRVLGLERIDELVQMGQRNLQQFHLPQATIRHAGTEALGLPGEQHHRILVSASAATKEPMEQLSQQLLPDGRLVVPVANSIWLVEKDQEQRLYYHEHPGFAFVPLR
ncbi:protein-L-isoaspartate O-methyltransferase [Desulfurispira natronophila]|uniref:Protein-L-isoaspartate O-methyltransferase n=1 Tax=Desulfurispira natronophila TaxID=682562 RepID=A0A7W8DH59_9BACT|nr:protein-L-isoaspartate(D-aspartate) O-methyltransferase [Desulfurispira natronophila]